MMPRNSGSTSQGFTLIELLVAMAVMSLVLVVLLQITGHILEITRSSRQWIASVQKARAALDSVGGDMVHLMDTRGLTIFSRNTVSGGANIELAILTQGRGPRGSNPSRFVAVDYRLEEGVLQRRVSPVDWSTTDLISEITVTAPVMVPDIIADGVLRFEAVAVLDDGTTVPVLESTTVTTNGFITLNLRNPVVSAPTASAPTVHCVRALIVAVATINNQALDILQSSGHTIEELASKLPRPIAGETPVEIWNQTLANGGLNQFPAPVLNTLQFMQTTFEMK